MDHANQHRRQLMKGVLGAAAVQGLPGLAFAQYKPRIRLEWQQFKQTSQYQSFLNAIAAMRQNNNAADRASLQYWRQVHETTCPHGVPYFISWHRGYLYYFEMQLRITSGDPTLNLPYWDYYSSPVLPAEFTDPAPSNPLYLPRTGTNVYNALSLWPFAPEVWNFQRGTTNAFEARIESTPHNPIHDLIGGIMSTMQSPLDPIFFLHHANIDRLTHAWALPDGKGIPDTAYPWSSTNSDPYWSGSNVYEPTLSIERYKTYNPTWLGYDYASNQKPTSLPPMSVTAQAGASRLPSSLRLPSNERPPFRTVTRLPAGIISPTRRSLGGAARIAFDERSLSVRVNLNAKDAADVAALVAARRSGEASALRGRVGSLKFVVDGVQLSKPGQLGGYFYALYLNMPPAIDSAGAYDRSFLGTLGAFQIASASHHGPARLEYDLIGLLAKQQTTDFSSFAFSWIRVDGDNPPAGQTISLQEARIELSDEAEPITLPRLKGLPGRYS